MDLEQLKNIIEASLLASQEPLSRTALGNLFNEQDAVSSEQIRQCLDALQDACGGRAIELVEVASGYRYQVRSDTYPWISRLWKDRPQRYSHALLETLALITYRQPVTRGEIEQVRGVVVSTHIMRTLEDREWVRVVGHRDTPGRPALYATTREFLDYFNLKSLDELPPLADIRDLTELEPQLSLDGSSSNPDAAIPAHQTTPTSPDPMTHELPQTDSQEQHL